MAPLNRRLDRFGLYSQQYAIIDVWISACNCSPFSGSANRAEPFNFTNSNTLHSGAGDRDIARAPGH
jgi:hypothetical protein